jgi:hypothetical protein
LSLGKKYFDKPALNIFVERKNACSGNAVQLPVQMKRQPELSEHVALIGL